MQVNFYSHGAAQEVTGSKHFLEFKGRRIIIDCGAFQGKRAEADAKNREWPFNARQLDAMILTHAHYDHCGLVPLLPLKGFKGNIYCTPATRDLASLIMMDSAHIQAKDYEFLKKRARKRGEEFDKEPLYSEKDVVESLNNFVTISYHRPFFLEDGVQATFYDAGHILGSAVTVVEINHNGQRMSIGFSGDLGRKNLPILRDPEYIPDVDYLVMESTYGDRSHEPIENATNELADAINQTINRGGKILIPSFAVERTQELVYFLHLLKIGKKIPPLPVFVDSPMATNATSIFRVHQECYDEETRTTFLQNHQNPFGFNELRYITNQEESKELNALQEPAIIISSSGMCEAGRILHHLIHNIEDSKNTILIVGYMAENTLGRKILEKQPVVKIFGDEYKLKADVQVLNTFSAHADYNDIMDYINQLNYKRLKGIFLVHGEAGAQENLKSLLDSKNFNSHIVRMGEKYTLQV
jgi:metallo-beta-lactamase family protein